MNRPREKALLPGFAGVALADILANGVAMVIILIVITVSIRNARERERLEQVQDLSVLLSRELATSVVMNALPSSPPSVLHDYQRSPLDQNPQHSIMPIVGLHREGVRNRYTGEVWPRRELLLQDNGFDRYLQSFNQDQRRRMRLDVHSIRNFYLAMSILKSHGIRPLHWHFYGEETIEERTALAGGGKSAGERFEGEERQRQRRLGRGAADGDNVARGRRGGPRLPAGARWRPRDGATAYPLVEEEPGDGRTAVQGFAGRPGQQQRSFRLRLPTPETSTGRHAMPLQPGEPIDAALILVALYRLLEDIQRRTNAGEYGALAGTHLERALAELFALPFDGAEWERAEAMVRSLQEPLPPPPGGVAVQRTVTDGVSALQLEADAQQLRTVIREHRPRGAPENEPEQTPDAGDRGGGKAIAEAVAGTAAAGADPGAGPGGTAAEVQLRMGQWPAIYQGLTVPLHHGGLALLAPGQERPQEWRWRLVTLTDRTLFEGTVGFVYAALDPDGKLLLAGEENGITVNGQPLRTERPVQPLRGERLLLVLYALLVAFVLAMLARRFRR